MKLGLIFLKRTTVVLVGDVHFPFRYGKCMSNNHGS